MISCRNISLDDDLEWDRLIAQSKTATFFQTKKWLMLWMKHWGKDVKSLIYAVYDGNELVGIAPFMINGDKINLLAIPDPSAPASLSDFGDIIAKTSYEEIIWKEVMANIKYQILNIKNTDKKLNIELNFIREESPSFEKLKKLGGKAQELEVSPIINLPKTWDEYLLTLDRHDRHELRRKIRRGEEAGVALDYYKGNTREIDKFFDLMVLGNEQKRNFLSREMKEFFRDLIHTFWQKQTLYLRFLKYEGKLIAATLSFIFKEEVLLYNSGFDPKFYHLSPGFILSVYAIKQAIEEGKERFDFLRGKEKYKYDLGGRKRKLYKISF